MFRVHEAPAPVRSTAIRVADAVCRRTGLRCSYNADTASLFFHYCVEPDGGPLSLPLYNEDENPIRYEEHEIDRAVEYVQLGKIGRRAKDKIAAQQAQREEWDRNEHTERHLADRRPGAVDYADFLDKKRRGTTKLISA